MNWRTISPKLTMDRTNDEAENSRRYSKQIDESDTPLRDGESTLSIDRRNLLKTTAIGMLGMSFEASGISETVEAASYAASVQTIASGEALGSNRRPNTFGLYDSSVDKSFVCYQGSNSDPYVQAFDHGSNSWTNPQAALSASVSVDLHNYPMMLQSDDGHIHLFYTEHNQMLYQATSPNASSIEGSWSEDTISEGPYATYPFPVKDSNGDIFVFYRETTQNDPDSNKETDYRPLQYVRSTDNRQSWSNNRTLTGEDVAIGHSRSDYLNEIYLGQVRREPAHDGLPERFHMVWTLAGGGGSAEGHEHDRYHENVYYAYFVPSELKFYNADGTDLGYRIDESDSDLCKVFDSLPPTNPETSSNPFDIGYRHLVHYTDAGDPLIIYEHIDKGLVATRWTGSSWSENSSDLAGNGIGDMERRGAQTFRFYAYDADTLRAFETSDAGASWSELGSINYPTDLHYTVNVIPNYKSPVKLFALEDGGGDVYVATDFATNDSSPPTSPSNLRVNSVTEMTADIEWDAATDSENRVEKYYVYIDGQQERVSTDLREVAKQLTPDTEYDFWVTAVDAAGNESTKSNIVTITTENDATAYYSLDTATATDESDNRNDGTNHEAGTGASGITNSCWNFDGDDDYLDCPPAAISGSDAYSVSVWAQSDPTDTDRTIVSFHPTDGFGVRYASSGEYTNNTSLIQVQHENDADQVSSFQHVAVTYSSTDGFSVYLDGTEVKIDAEQNNGGSLAVDQLQLAATNGSGGFWNGKLDEIRFYQRELTSSEVQSLYQQDNS